MRASVSRRLYDPLMAPALLPSAVRDPDGYRIEKS
jgi:hypothetical protein